MRTRTRTMRDLTKTQKQRMTTYIRTNYLVPSTELADDLNLDYRTVVACKAWATRQINNLLK